MVQGGSRGWRARDADRQLDLRTCHPAARPVYHPGHHAVPRFADNPLVTGDPHLRFYAGALLETPEGFPLGTVCVLDYKPRELDENQKAFLRLMASQVMKLLELRRINAREHAARLRAEELVRENATLVREGDHRVMNSLQLVKSVLSLQSRSAVSPETKAQLDMASNRVLAIATVHKQLHLTGSLEEIDFDAFLHRLSESLKSTAPPHITAIKVTAENAKLRSDLASGMGMLVADSSPTASSMPTPTDSTGSSRWTSSRPGTDGVWRSRTKDRDCRPASILVAARALECRS